MGSAQSTLLPGLGVTGYSNAGDPRTSAVHLRYVDRVLLRWFTGASMDQGRFDFLPICFATLGDYNHISAYQGAVSAGRGLS
jgi:hypothetical protein